ncbi:MAG: hypothetical protein A3I05_07450 [Deltaproteobacteria bacterium RIFCSPLOWO2_02_FULL_44_10]|nr:MAG: hypothetical protein A3C46_00480 [Deltaproteobacteria bacterium RIFCSPHIGHO2_02_FULL_44_16]OGQ47364.1 MAG: hypothetical protein A3I05_07450 [Deltaproteobacteria bacterium RIFCSPLOWO2_02_FULL_44_10]
MAPKIEKPGFSLSIRPPEQETALLPGALDAARRLSARAQSSTIIAPPPSDGFLNALRNLFGASAVASMTQLLDNIEKLPIGHHPEVLTRVSKLPPSQAARPIRLLFDRSDLQGRFDIEQTVVLHRPELADRSLLERLFHAWFRRTTPEELGHVYADATTIAEAHPFTSKAAFNLGWHRTMLKGFASEDANIPEEVSKRLDRLFPRSSPFQRIS